MPIFIRFRDEYRTGLVQPSGWRRQEIREQYAWLRRDGLSRAAARSVVIRLVLAGGGAELVMP